MTGLPRIGTAATTEHFFWIDLIRVVAVFQVILVHLSFPIFYKENLPRSYWFAANFYDSISRIGVPLFFMVSGALLLNKMESVTEFLKKRFLKVGVPTIFWSVFYLFWSVEPYRNGSMHPVRILLSILKTIYLGNIEIHLWFLFILIGIYLVVPILRILVLNASHQDLLYFLGLWLITTSLIESIGKVTGLITTFSIPVVAGYVGFFILGYVLTGIKMTSKGLVLAAYGIITAVLITYFGTNMLSASHEPIDSFLYSYFSFPTVLASICGFLILKEAGGNLGKSETVTKFLSEVSFGVFLIHILVIDLLRKGFFGFKLYSWAAHPVIMIPTTATVVFAVSVLAVFLLRKVPLIRFVVP